MRANRRQTKYAAQMRRMLQDIARSPQMRARVSPNARRAELAAMGITTPGLINASAIARARDAINVQRTVSRARDARGIAAIDWQTVFGEQDTAARIDTVLEAAKASTDAALTRSEARSFVQAVDLIVQEQSASRLQSSPPQLQDFLARHGQGTLRGLPTPLGQVQMPTGFNAPDVAGRFDAALEDMDIPSAIEDMETYIEAGKAVLAGAAVHFGAIGAGALAGGAVAGPIGTAVAAAGVAIYDCASSLLDEMKEELRSRMDRLRNVQIAGQEALAEATAWVEAAQAGIAEAGARAEEIADQLRSIDASLAASTEVSEIQNLNRERAALEAEFANLNQMAAQLRSDVEALAPKLPEMSEAVANVNKAIQDISGELSDVAGSLAKKAWDCGKAAVIAACAVIPPQPLWAGVAALGVLLFEEVNWSEVWNGVRDWCVDTARSIGRSVKKFFRCLFGCRRPPPPPPTCDLIPRSVRLQDADAPSDPTLVRAGIVARATVYIDENNVARTDVKLRSPATFLRTQEYPCAIYEAFAADIPGVRRHTPDGAPLSTAVGLIDAEEWPPWLQRAIIAGEIVVRPGPITPAGSQNDGRYYQLFPEQQDPFFTRTNAERSQRQKLVAVTPENRLVPVVLGQALFFEVSSKAYWADQGGVQLNSRNPYQMLSPWQQQDAVESWITECEAAGLMQKESARLEEGAKPRRKQLIALTLTTPAVLESLIENRPLPAALQADIERKVETRFPVAPVVAAGVALALLARRA